jgi:hypothetical protein
LPTWNSGSQPDLTALKAELETMIEGCSHGRVATVPRLGLRDEMERFAPSRDKHKAVRFYAKIFGLEYDGPGPHFAVVKLNKTLTFDFSDSATFDFHHYASHVSNAEFDSIISRIIKLEIPYGGSYRSPEDRQLNSTNIGR